MKLLKFQRFEGYRIFLLNVTDRVMKKDVEKHVKKYTPTMLIFDLGV